MELHENLNLKWLYKHKNEVLPGYTWYACKILFPNKCREIKEEVKDGQKKRSKEI